MDESFNIGDLARQLNVAPSFRTVVPIPGVREINNNFSGSPGELSNGTPSYLETLARTSGITSGSNKSSDGGCSCSTNSASSTYENKDSGLSEGYRELTLEPGEYVIVNNVRPLVINQTSNVQMGLNDAVIKVK